MVKSWLWNTHSQSSYLNTSVRELMVQGIFQWNGTIFDTKFLTLLLFSLCLEKVVCLEVTDS